MPTYEYECREHGVFEQLRPMQESRAATPCPTCASLAPRILSAPVLSQLSRHTRVALDRNERSRHEPTLVQRAAEPSRDAPRAPTFRAGGGRPWALEHG